jgi:hypothetical protein
MKIQSLAVYFETFLIAKLFLYRKFHSFLEDYRWGTLIFKCPSKLRCEVTEYKSVCTLLGLSAINTYLMIYSIGDRTNRFLVALKHCAHVPQAMSKELGIRYEQYIDNDDSITIIRKSPSS